MVAEGATPFEIIASHEQAGCRLDRLLAQHLKLGRRRIARLFEEGRVHVQGVRASKGMSVEVGQVIRVDVPPPDAAQPEPELLLDVRLLRDDLVVVNKPAGMPSTVLRAGDQGTLAGALLGRFPEMRGVGHGPGEPGLVHRLDTHTSGLLVAARNSASFAILRQALEQHQLSKRYLAIVPDFDVPDGGQLRAKLSPHPKNRRKVWVLPDEGSEGRPSSLEYRVLQRSLGLALLQVSVGPAYRHQIRVQLAHAGWPIVGDELYGAPSTSRLGPGRHALHASYIRCEAAGIRDFEVESELPQDMLELLK